MTKTIIGIDPGASGGIAWRRGNGQIYAVPMPDTQGDMLAQLRMIRQFAEEDSIEAICYMEKLPLFIGGSDIPGSRIGVMFENVGFCKGVVQTLGIALYEITPQTWMKSLGIGTVTRQRAPNGASIEIRGQINRENQAAKREWKRKLRSEAQRRYPNLTITLEKADAVLILDYGLRQQNGVVATDVPEKASTLL